MSEAQEHIEKLLEFILSNSPLFVLTGAGCSTDSGIPDYRDHEGNWKYSKPVQYFDFLSQEYTRKRYWARSMAGWPRIHKARPNSAHIALARLEQAGLIHLLVTQNVDGLHRKAGSNRVLDLHGNLENVICVGCRRLLPRGQLQDTLLEENVRFAGARFHPAPDGDAYPDSSDYDAFKLPVCDACNGILKPDVVFFGENIPGERIAYAMQKLRESSAILVIGSSLMVFSGYRFVREAAKYRMPAAAINIGKTRADDLLTLKCEMSCAMALDRLSRRIVGIRTDQVVHSQFPGLNVKQQTEQDIGAGKQAN